MRSRLFLLIAVSALLAACTSPTLSGPAEGPAFDEAAPEGSTGPGGGIGSGNGG